MQFAHTQAFRHATRSAIRVFIFARCPFLISYPPPRVQKEVGTSKTPRRRQHAAVHDAEYDVVEPHLCLFGGVTSFAAVGSNEKVLENAVEYDGKYYKLAGDDEVKLFLDKPDFFLHRSRIEDVPHHIPLLQTKELYAFAQHNGYCPVKLADAPEEGPVPASCLERGRRRFLAMYKGKFFALSSADALSSFLRTPWKYTDGKLPLKLPHVVPENEAQRTLPIGNLPTLGYLEQTVSAVLLSALNEVGKERPFLPSADAKTSAVRLLAGIIRANNPNAKPFQKRRAEEELAKMREDMTLVDYLSEKLAKRGGGESDEEVNSKLERYNELEEGRVYAPSSH
uniref:Uncharacterized protein n=1 Tax=Palpitomonas bilix TaxID=652834 RepID=A0A7S3DEM6_9EUKA|mmetsp:Transcript_34542/g.89526  ORF Transcript_34542/g.89526 Transcript_34542/m.89526 type:complete len:339 (+) Transcript_34542:1975-2991(+)